MMKPIELAMKYMDIFFNGQNMEELAPLLSDEFSFQGPLFKFSSAKSYIESLQKDPPVGCEYKILHSLETSTSAVLFYLFSKPGIEVTMAQLFEVQDEKITNILLIFDSKEFN